MGQSIVATSNATITLIFQPSAVVGRVLRLRRNNYASFDSLLSHAILGKGWIRLFVALPLEDFLAIRLFYPS